MFEWIPKHVTRVRRQSLSLLGPSVLALGSAFALGCAPGTATPPAPQTPHISPSGLTHVPSVRNGSLYLKPDHHIGSYDGFFIKPIEVTYRRGQQPLSDERLQELGSRLRQGLEQSIVQSGLELAKEPNECVLALALQIHDLQLLDIGDAGRSTTRFVTSAGGAALYFEYRDSVSGQLLVQYGQRRSFPGGTVLTAGALSAQGLSQRLGEAFGDMGNAMRIAMPRTTAPREGAAHCEGRIAKLGELQDQREGQKR